MRIGILAERAGVSSSRIRFYEARGLVPPASRLASGYRDYPERALEVLRFVTRARALGFSVEQVATFLASPKDSGRKARLLASVEAKLRQVDAELDELRQRRGTLVKVAAELRSLRDGSAGKPR